MSIRVMLKNGSAIDVEDVKFSAVKRSAEQWAAGSTESLTFSNKVVIFTREISHILNTGDKKVEAPIVAPIEVKPFYEGCSMRCVVYEGDGETASLIHCNHPNNPDPHEGNCRKDICPVVNINKDKP